MDAKGHIALGAALGGAATVAASYYTKSPVVVTAGGAATSLGYLVGTLFLDIDHPKSKLGRYFNISLFNKDYGLSTLVNHRGITHTIYFIMLLFFLGGALKYMPWEAQHLASFQSEANLLNPLAGKGPALLQPFIMGLAWGSCAHLIGDMLTSEGVRLFYIPKLFNGPTIGVAQFNIMGIKPLKILTCAPNEKSFRGMLAELYTLGSIVVAAGSLYLIVNQLPVV